MNHCDEVFKRDGFKCKICGWMLNTGETELHAHRIEDCVTSKMITLCSACLKAVQSYPENKIERFSACNLYMLIGA